LWTTALAAMVMLRAAGERWYFAGFSRSQESPKARFTRFAELDRIAGWLPLSRVRRHLLVKDVRIFMRDVSQWSQLLLLVALVLLYLYNFRVLDLQRIPYMSGFLKNVYAFVNLAMAGMVMATVTVRFVFPAVSSEGAAFWIVRTSPVRLRDFLWSKFWAGLFPVLLLTELLTVVANQFLGVDPFLQYAAALAIACMSFALVGLGIGLGARYPRFGADPSQVAGSYGGVAFMVQAVLFVIVIIALTGWPASIYLMRHVRGLSLTAAQELLAAGCAVAALAASTSVWLGSMRSGVAALEKMSD
jgi:ABC-2 type transport system permease protein